MEGDAFEPPPPSSKYASTRIDSGDGDIEASVKIEVDLDFIETGVLPWEPKPEGRRVEDRLGQAVLRLRLYRGWSQAMLERVSGVDQTLISRFERGKVPGMAVRKLYALLRALRAEEITFGPGPRTVPQSSWENAMYGDMWERAGRLAERRLSPRHTS